MKKLWVLVLAGCLAAVLSTAAWASETSTTVSTEDELTAALNNSAVTTIQLVSDDTGNDIIEISNTLVVTRDVTLDLNGKVLKMTGSGSVIKVESGTLTLKDSNRDVEHKFTDNNGLWELAENGDKLVKGGVITGANSSSYGGGVYVAPKAKFVMTGGNIVGCHAYQGGGVYVDDRNPEDLGEFQMSGGAIIGCTASEGGGIRNSGITKLSGKVTILNCTANNVAGIYSNRNLSIDCNSDAHFGEIYSVGGSINGGTFTDKVTVNRCTVKSGIFEKVVACSGCTIEDGTFRDEVYSSSAGTINGGTFEKKVTNDQGTITNGTFNGTVDNTGTIRDGIFTNEVTNSALRDSNGEHFGIIEGGTFKAKVINTTEATEDDNDYYYSGTIKNGRFEGGLINKGSTVNGGTFISDVTNETLVIGDVSHPGIINGGTFKGKVSGAWTVKFDTDGGSTAPDNQVRANSKVNKPDDPTKEGYIFGGWYNGDEKFDFEQAVSGDKVVTLYAKWTEKQETVAEQPKYYYKASGGETTETKGSPKTFDAGVGVYAGMAVLSLAGMACVGKKRH